MLRWVGVECSLVLLDDKFRHSPTGNRQQGHSALTHGRGQSQSKSSNQQIPERMTVLRTLPPNTEGLLETIPTIRASNNKLHSGPQKPTMAPWQPHGACTTTAVWHTSIAAAKTFTRSV